jgi:hypothetical protein
MTGHGESLDPLRFLLVCLGGWMNQSQLQIIDYLREENRVLREQLGHLGSGGEIQRRQRLGGMLNYFYRAAV